MLRQYRLVYVGFLSTEPTSSRRSVNRWLLTLLLFGTGLGIVLVSHEFNWSAVTDLLKQYAQNFRTEMGWVGWTLIALGGADLVAPLFGSRSGAQSRAYGFLPTRLIFASLVAVGQLSLKGRTIPELLSSPGGARGAFTAPLVITIAMGIVLLIVLHVREDRVSSLAYSRAILKKVKREGATEFVAAGYLDQVKKNRRSLYQVRTWIDGLFYASVAALLTWFVK